MLDALLARASTRFVFVAGKGGVGKTTTAGALALALSDAGTSTHLISTDPAHSLRDLLPEDCNHNLAIEEFDARAYADAFFARLREPLTELIEHGTYLDAIDARSFLDLSIPGIDEVMAALRLVDLLDTAAARIVVDTAPTGHTLRLLESPRIIESWIDAGFAMAEKAGVVSAALVGQPVPLAALPLLREWQRAAARFDREVLGAGRAVVVTRAGHVVAAETDRLKSSLEARGLAVAATVATGPHAAADFSVALVEDATGCDGLRQWAEHLGPGPETTAENTTSPRVQPDRSPRPAAESPAWLESVAAPLIWVAGKGGVGKSTIAASLATALAEKRTVCVVSTDPAGSLTEIFGTAVGTEATEIAPRLYARQIDAPAEFARMREQFRDTVNEFFASFGLQQAAQLDRRVVESLWDFAPPGIDEIIALIEILEQAERYDTLIIDSAPTGHFLRLIEMPELALDWVHSLLRLLVKYRAAGSLDALAGDLLAFAKRLKQLKLELSTPTDAAVLVVLLDEAMVRAESRRLTAALERAGVPVTAEILNRSPNGASQEARSRHIRAPLQATEIVGPAALRSFLSKWEFHGE